jgi:hypothetical protein
MQEIFFSNLQLYKKLLDWDESCLRSSRGLVFYMVKTS